MEQTQAVTTTATAALAAAPMVTKEDVEGFILGSSLARSLTPAQRDLCIKTALTWGLNPLKREIHFVNDRVICTGGRSAAICGLIAASDHPGPSAADPRGGASGGASCHCPAGRCRGR